MRHGWGCTGFYRDCLRLTHEPYLPLKGSIPDNVASWGEHLLLGQGGFWLSINQEASRNDLNARGDEWMFLQNLPLWMIPVNASGVCGIMWRLACPSGHKRLEQVSEDDEGCYSRKALAHLPGSVLFFIGSTCRAGIG